MIRKYLLTIVLIASIVLSANAASLKEILSSVENGVFGYDYSNESDTKRVERLEEYMYGEKKIGSINKRIETIQNDSGIVTLVKTPKNPPIMDENNTVNTEQKPKPVLKEDETVEYPIVDKMEYDVYKQTYANENIYDRLNRLETTIFQKTSNKDLNERVDRLAALINPDSRRMPIEEEATQDYIQRMYNNNGIAQIDSQTLPFQLATLESDILKHDYSTETNTSRLARLEQKLFSKTFPNEADTQRLQRVLAAYEAKKDSYKYENNRRMQNVATISQIGGILLMILAILL